MEETQLPWLAVTGTRNGMTYPQHQSVRRVLISLGVRGVSHGDCLGFDLELHVLAQSLWLGKTPVRVRPPSNPSLRAFCTGGENVEIMKPEPYLVRNDHILDDGDLLLAAPKGRTEELRSGTWATIRHALRRGMGVFIAYPDGTVCFRMGDEPERLVSLD